MSIFFKAYNFITHVKFKLWGQRTGKGRRIHVSQWNEEFADGRWEYLKNDRQTTRYKAIMDILAKHKTKPAILDVGCGEGILVDHLIQKKIDFSDYLGLDISSQAITKAQHHHPTVKFETADAEKYIASSGYDIIIFNECIYYFRNPLLVLHNFERYLNKNGIYIMSVFNNKNYFQILDSIRKSYPCNESKIVSDGISDRWIISIFSPLDRQYIGPN